MNDTALTLEWLYCEHYDGAISVAEARGLFARDPEPSTAAGRALQARATVADIDELPELLRTHPHVLSEFFADNEEPDFVAEHHRVIRRINPTGPANPAPVNPPVDDDREALARLQGDLDSLNVDTIPFRDDGDPTKHRADAADVLAHTAYLLRKLGDERGWWI